MATHGRGEIGPFEICLESYVSRPELAGDGNKIWIETTALRKSIKRAPGYTPSRSDPKAKLEGLSIRLS